MEDFEVDPAQVPLPSDTEEEEPVTPAPIRTGTNGFDWVAFVELQRQLAISMEYTEAEMKKFISAEVRSEKRRQAEEAVVIRQEQQEAKERAQEREIAERAAIRKEELEHALNLKRLELEVQQRTPSPVTMSGAPTLPRLEKYRLSDPLDEYLHNMECLCSVYNVSEEEQVKQLYGLLPQGLVNVINQIPEENRMRYATVKEALLVAGHYTAEDFRTRYLRAVPAPTESGTMWGRRKYQLLKDWARRSNVDVKPEAESVLEWWVWDAMSRLLPMEVLTPVRNELKGGQDLGKALEALDRVMACAFPTKRLSEILIKPNSAQGLSNPPPAGGAEGGLHQNNHKKKKNRKTTNEDSKDPKDTPKAHPPHPNASHQHPVSNKPSSGVNLPQGQRSAQPTGRNGPWSRPPTRSLHGIVTDNVPLEDSEETSVLIGSLSLGGTNGVPMCTGQINGYALPITLDTAAEGIFLDAKFIDSGQYTGKTQLVQLVEGPPVRRPKARVPFESAFLKGSIEVVALYNPQRPVFVGRLNMPSFDKKVYDQVVTTWKEDMVPETSFQLPPNLPSPDGGREAATPSPPTPPIVRRRRRRRRQKILQKRR